jgi:hypothetical protein
MDSLNPSIKKLILAKEVRRRDLARLPYPEKVKIVVELQKMAAPLLQARGQQVHPWKVDEIQS